MANCTISAQYTAEPTFFEAGSTIAWTVTAGNATITAGSDALTVTVESDSDVDETFTLHCVLVSPSYGTTEIDFSRTHYRYDYTVEQGDPFRDTNPSQFVTYILDGTVEPLLGGSDVSPSNIWNDDITTGDAGLRANYGDGPTFKSGFSATGKQGLIISNKDGEITCPWSGHSNASEPFERLNMFSANIVFSCVIANDNKSINSGNKGYVIGLYGFNWSGGSNNFVTAKTLHAGFGFSNNALVFHTGFVLDQVAFEYKAEPYINIISTGQTHLSGIKLIDDMVENEKYAITVSFNVHTGVILIYLNGELHCKAKQNAGALRYAWHDSAADSNVHEHYLSLCSNYSFPIKVSHSVGFNMEDTFQATVACLRMHASNNNEPGRELTECQLGLINKTDYDAYQ